MLRIDNFFSGSTFNTLDVKKFLVFVSWLEYQLLVWKRFDHVLILSQSLDEWKRDYNVVRFPKIPEEPLEAPETIRFFVKAAVKRPITEYRLIG